MENLNSLKDFRVAQGTLGTLACVSYMLRRALYAQDKLGRIGELERAYRLILEAKADIKLAVSDFEAAMILAGEYPLDCDEDHSASPKDA